MRVTEEKCPKCGRLNGMRHRAITKSPSLATMERWVSKSVAKATDGCRVEPDGVCEHGHTSWLRVLGFIEE